MMKAFQKHQSTHMLFYSCTQLSVLHKKATLIFYYLLFLNVADRERAHAGEVSLGTGQNGSELPLFSCRAVRFAHAPGSRVLLLFSPAPLGSRGAPQPPGLSGADPRSAGLRHVPVTQQMSAATVPGSSPRSFQRRAQPVPERGPSTQKLPHKTRAATAAGKAPKARSRPQAVQWGRAARNRSQPVRPDAASSRLPGPGRGQWPPPGAGSRARPLRSSRVRAGPGRALPRRAPLPPSRALPAEPHSPGTYTLRKPMAGRQRGRMRGSRQPEMCARAELRPRAPSDAPGARHAGTARHLGAGPRAGPPSAFSRLLGSTPNVRCSGGAEQIYAACCGRSCEGGATPPRERSSRGAWGCSVAAQDRSLHGAFGRLDLSGLNVAGKPNDCCLHCLLPAPTSAQAVVRSREQTDTSDMRSVPPE